MTEREFLSGIAQIYRSARYSDDGERCMVAPNPELRERIKTAIATLAANTSTSSMVESAAPIA